MFGVPYEYYEKYGIRRYGFHGTSHRYRQRSLLRAAGQAGRRRAPGSSPATWATAPPLRRSRTARSIDTTMGLTPLDGFLMGTRSGAHGSLGGHLPDGEGGAHPPRRWTTSSTRSPVCWAFPACPATTGISPRRWKRAIDRAKLAWDMRTYEIVKYIGGYVAALGGVDAIVFTAGIGENQIDAACGRFSAPSVISGLKVDEQSATTCRGKESGDHHGGFRRAGVCHSHRRGAGDRPGYPRDCGSLSGDGIVQRGTGVYACPSSVAGGVGKTPRLPRDPAVPLKRRGLRYQGNG